MLRKLMKHELRATGRVMLPLYLVVLVTSVGANLSTRVLTELDFELLNLLGFLLMTAFVFAIVGVCLVSFLLMIRRFYKNLLQDEGYVMMTLPVSVHQQVWAKLLVSLLWFVATAVVVIAAVLIVTFDIRFVKDLAAMGGEWFRAIGDFREMIRIDHAVAHAVGFGVEVLALLFVGAVCACLQFYSAMAIGHSFASHKILWSVVFYFAIQSVLQMLGGSIVITGGTTGIGHVLGRMFSGAASVHAALLIMIGATIACGTVFYFLTTYFLKNRLNLE